ncbi:Auxin-responsive protein, partial [Thalictrum thalictroides]
MDSSSNVFETSPSYNSFYHGVKDDIIIDLGLSLGNSLQSEPEDPYHSSRNSFVHESVVSQGEYGEYMGWPQLKSYMKNSDMVNPLMIPQSCDDETEGVQSSERWVYVKVNMDGVVVGRKVCILDHAGYSSLAHQLEEMFGK